MSEKFCESAGGCLCRCEHCGKSPYSHCKAHGRGCHIACKALHSGQPKKPKRGDRG